MVQHPVHTLPLKVVTTELLLQMAHAPRRQLTRMFRFRLISRPLLAQPRALRFAREAAYY